MDYTQEIQEAVGAHGFGDVLQVVGNEPFEVILHRDGAMSWWSRDSFVTDAQIDSPRDNLEYKKTQVRGGTFLIAYRVSATVDMATARSAPNRTKIVTVFARRQYSPERLVAALISTQAIAGS